MAILDEVAVPGCTTPKPDRSVSTSEPEWSDSRPVLKPIEIARMFKRGQTISQIATYFQQRESDIEEVLRDILIMPSSARYYS